MTTYYAAQLGIALSVVDSRGCYFKEEENRKQQQQKLELQNGSIRPDGHLGHHQRRASIGGGDLRHRLDAVPSS